MTQAGRSWDERISAVEQQYPSTVTSWAEPLQDVSVMGRLIGGALRVDSTPAGTRGQTPALDYQTGMARLRQLWGDDYSSLPFPEAFQVLAGGRSVAELERVTGISRSRITRITAGLATPSGKEMEMAAAAFGKPAIYWTEYRNGLVLMAVAAYLAKAPEISVGLVRQLSSHA